MPTYTAFFRTDAEYAQHDFEAATPAQALQMARTLWERDPDTLAFEHYDSMLPLDEIEISALEGHALAVWHNDEMRLRLAARELLEALEKLIDKADDMIAAIDGAADQFEREVAALCAATSEADNIRTKVRGGA